MILSFDVESNGLMGEGFAVGAVIINSRGEETERVYMRAPVQAKFVDSWVKDNVLPHLPDETHDSVREMRKEFWEFLQDNMTNGMNVLGDVIYPVEANFLLACQKQKGNADDGPYPLLDVNSMLASYMEKSQDADRIELLTDLAKVEKPAEYKQHHPTWDAWASGLVAYHIFKDSKFVRRLKNS